MIGARTVVEIGTGCGVSALWLLRGMAAPGHGSEGATGTAGAGVLTSIDESAEHQRLARQAFAAAEIPPGRVRLIGGRALDVLPRLTDGGYDLVFADAAKAEYPDYLEQARRLLRPGGIVAFDNALWHDRVADPANRDAETLAVREVHRAVRTDPELTPVLLPVGDGLLAAVTS